MKLVPSRSNFVRIVEAAPTTARGIVTPVSSQTCPPSLLLESYTLISSKELLERFSKCSSLVTWHTELRKGMPTDAASHEVTGRHIVYAEWEAFMGTVLYQLSFIGQSPKV